MNTNMNTVEPRIYVACLNAYNNGRLVGAWIDVTDPDTMADEIAAITPHETAIHDYEGFNGWIVNEQDSLAEICAIADAMEEHGVAFILWLRNTASGESVEDSIQRYEDESPFCGCWDSLADYAEEWLTDIGALAGVCPLLAQYFDYEAYGRDLENGGDIWTERHDGDLYVFNNH
jgi:antirestriction protein